MHILINTGEYKKAEYNPQEEDESFQGIIGQLNSKGILKIQFEEKPFRKQEIPKDKCIPNEKELYIRDCILNESAYAACDGSMKDHLFAGYCVITDAAKSRSVSKYCKSNQ